MNYLTNIEGLSRNRAKVTAPAPAKYPGSETLLGSKPAFPTMILGRCRIIV